MDRPVFRQFAAAGGIFTPFFEIVVSRKLDLKWFKSVFLSENNGIVIGVTSRRLSCCSQGLEYLNGPF